MACNTSMSKVQIYLRPREHKEARLKAVVRASKKDEVLDGAVTAREVEDLCESVRIDLGTMVLAWVGTR